jgi:hypothetical protein
LYKPKRNRSLNRRIIESTVVRTRNASCIAIASPGDFVCTHAVSGAVPRRDAFPYSLDFVRRRTIYVRDIDPHAVQEAPFYYLYLRRHAQRVLSIPVEYGPLASSEGEDPVFLFSPGRCGSTLLSRVLFEAGIASVSEPDFYTQMASWFWSRRSNPLRPAFERAMWALSGDLTAGLGAAPVVKLRAECARAPELFVRNPSARTVVLLRGFEGWAQSTAKAFGAGSGKAVRKYMTALDCYAWLCRHSCCHLMWYEDWLSDPERAARALSAFLGRPLCATAVARARQSHSQVGTPLIDRARPGWHAKWQAALKLWQAPRLVTARQRLEIPALWD